MAQWGNTDDAANSVLWATARVNLPGNTDNQANLYGNVTPGGTVTGLVMGQFAVDATEIGVVANSGIAAYQVVFAGSGYGSNAVVTVANSTGGANVSVANSTVVAGRVTALTVIAVIGGYAGLIPSVTIAAPSAVNVTANSTGFSNSADTIILATANSKFLADDKLLYSVPAGNTAIAPLTANTYYWVAAANSTTIQLAATKGGAAIDIVDTRVTDPAEVHTLTGETATGAAVPTGAPGAAHTGWVLRKVGTGGRAGRVQCETLVAMNSFGDDGEDTVMKDA